MASAGGGGPAAGGRPGLVAVGGASGRGGAGGGESGSWVIPGGSNIGVIEVAPGKACLVDAGSDAEAAKKALKLLAQARLAVEAVIITHAHADHTGGARTIRDRTGCRVVASRFEAAVMRAPVLEPVYLYGGAVPPRELASGDLVAPPCEADEVVMPGTSTTVGDIEVDLVDLAGHTPGQIGVASGDVVFCGDAIFPSYVFQKYGVAVAYDLDAIERALQRLKEFAGDAKTPAGLGRTLVPGHGKPLSGAEASREIDANQAALGRLTSVVESALAEARSAEEAEVVALALQKLGASPKGPAYYYLCRTSILAALVRLQKRDGYSPVTEGTRLLWKKLSP